MQECTNRGISMSNRHSRLMEHLTLPETETLFSLFARWFQLAQISQLTVFSSHNKSAPVNPNQSRNQPANRPIVSNTEASVSCSFS